MGFPIEDGTGKSYQLKINSENQLEALCVAIPEDRHINVSHETVWSLPFKAIDPAGANDYFLYIKNTGTKNLGITDIRISSTVAGTVEVHNVSGTPTYVVGTDITPVNRYIGSNTTLNATAKTDTDITGLTNEGIVFFIDIDTANKLEHLRTTSNIVIPPGQSISLMWDTATGVLKGVVSIVELQVL